MPRRRGRVLLRAIEVTTAYPFGIFAKSRTFRLEARAVAWPARVPPGRLPVGEGEPTERGGWTARGGDEDLDGLREYREGDDARHVHWRRSLRLATLVVVERARPGGRRVRLRIGAGRGEPFEDALRLAAARAEACLARGDEVEVLGAVRVRAGAGAGHRRRILTALALAGEEGERAVA